ncbi:hypothetical protein HPB52_008995 [Rhipicephalus sanguineus]|uniref:Uncharacterized protein n=1 Tax=Rhipicephalus sanguineus TaxID=34632 RepID=A0A9D4PMK8_RHISA|nr:hypothetical protein HPB52_008995 [Rhipicephalus sanguineus]
MRDALSKIVRTRRWLAGDASSRRLMPTAKNASVGLGYLKQHRVDRRRRALRHAPAGTTSTEAAAAQAMPVADDTSRTMRVDTLLVSEAEKVAIEHRAEAQRQKLSLHQLRAESSRFGDSPEAAGCGTEFTLLSLPLLNQLLRCAKCEFCSGPLNDGDPRYSEWRARHKCQKNSSSKPGQMEVEAAKILFGRSLENMDCVTQRCCATE